MSRIADNVYSVLKEIFPYNTIIKEEYIWYKGSRLFFDFYIKDLGILVEVQGKQHFEYCDHFHGSVEAFRAQKHRDNLKKDYVQCNPEICLVYFYDGKDKINKKLVLKRIFAAQHKEEGV